MDKYYLRAVRIAAKQKLPERWIHSQWYQPLDAEDAGTTFVLIEVLNPWFPSPQITTAITNTFNREYFRQRRVSSATDAFEIAVRRVNEALAARAEEGETDWIGNLHAVLAVVSGNELHLVQAGRGLAFIYRQGSLNRATSDRLSVDEPPPPLQTFASIVTGSLEPGDKGILATPDFTDYISTEQLGTTLGKTIDEAALEIVKELQHQKIKTPHAVLFDYSATPHAERKPDEADTLFLDQPLEGSLARIKQRSREVVLPAIASGVKSTGSAASWFWGKTKTDVLPKVRSGIGSLAQKSKTGLSSAAQKASPVVSAISEKAQDSLSNVAMQGESMDKRSFLTRLVSPLANILNRFISFARSIKLNTRVLSIGLAIAVLVVLGIRLVTIRQQGEVKVAKSVAQEALASAQTKKQDADLALIADDKDRAVMLYVEAISLAKQARDNPDVKNAAEEVLAGALKSLDDLTDTVRISDAKPIASFQSPTRFSISRDTIWVVDDNGNVENAALTGIGPKGLGQIQGAGKAVTILITDAAGVDGSANDQLIFIVGSEGIGLVKAPEGATELLAEPEGGWEEAVAADVYGSTLYLLDESSGQIWKYATTRDGVSSPPTKYFADAQNLIEAIDLAIDGRIYVLFSDGTINRYFKGASETFTVAGLPKPYDKFVKPTMIATNSEAAGLYIFDSSDKRIVELDKTGAYKRQFALPENWEVKDILIAEGKLFVLADNNVYEISL